MTSNYKCKCCLQYGRKDLWAKYPHRGEVEIYGDMLSKCFGISWKPKPPNTERICLTCIGQLRNACAFKMKVLYTEELMLDHSNGPLNPDELELKIKRQTQTKILQDIPEPMSGVNLISDDDQKYDETNAYDTASDDVGKEKNNIAEGEYEDVEYLEDVILEKDMNLGNSIYLKDEGFTDLENEDTNVSYSEDEDEDEDERRKLKSVRINAVGSSKQTENVKDDNAENSKTEIAVPKKSVIEIAAASNVVRDKHLHNLRLILKNSNATPLHKQSDRGYSCYFCKEDYQNPLDLKAHVGSFHKNKFHTFMGRTHLCDFEVRLDITDLHCTLCDRLVYNLAELLGHFRDDHSFTVHMDLEHRMIEAKFDSDHLKCYICNEPMTFFRNLLSHMRKHYKNHECESCGEWFMTVRKLKGHILLKHGNGYFPCSKCTKVFPSKYLMSTHEYSVHKVKRNVFKCGFCGIRFDGMDKKLRHIKNFHGIDRKPFKCTMCGKFLSSSKTLKTHIDRHMNIHPVKKHKCPICEKYFRSLNYLRDRHMVKHTKEKNFRCNICSKALSSSAALNQHMRIHNNDRRHKCKMCDSRFVHYNSKVLHEKKYCPNKDV